VRETYALAVRGMLIKRVFDVVVAGAGLILSAPLWAIIAVAIKLEDRGPVFFTQSRVGRCGVTFTAYKFRSMIPDAAHAPPRQATQGDPRVTRVGHVLRPTAMDELPQLWNIFRGDMSFVGPRPLMPGEIELRGDGRTVPLDAIEGYQARHAVMPGLTGLAQIYAPRDVRRAAKFRLDRLYAQRATFWLDLKLIAISFWISARGRWEHRTSKL
jgi:lipopolysaccharide/colanic/teichoic acid biosynthesis glycosyltransferase